MFWRCSSYYVSHKLAAFQEKEHWSDMMKVWDVSGPHAIVNVTMNLALYQFAIKEIHEITNKG